MLPEGFKARMKKLLGEEYAAFESVLEAQGPVRERTSSGEVKVGPILRSRSPSYFAASAVSSSVSVVAKQGSSSQITILIMFLLRCVDKYIIAYRRGNVNVLCYYNYTLNSRRARVLG